MDTFGMDTYRLYLPILVAVFIAALIGVARWSRAQGRRKWSRRVPRAELQKPEQGVDRLPVIPLSAADPPKFRQAWNLLQRRFIDDPKDAVMRADRLVYDLMAARGYPMGEHPAVVAHYRAARAIARSAEHGHADTEKLRKAVVNFRELFRELLEIDEPGRPVPPVR